MFSWGCMSLDNELSPILHVFAVITFFSQWHHFPFFPVQCQCFSLHSFFHSAESFCLFVFFPDGSPCLRRKCCTEIPDLSSGKRHMCMMSFEFIWQNLKCDHDQRPRDCVFNHPSYCRRNSFCILSECDIKLGTPAASLPSAWWYRVSTGSGWPGVSILWLGEIESLVCRFYLSVAACKIEQIHPWDTLACCLDVKQPANKQTSCQRSTLCVGQQISIPVVLLSCV